MADAREGAGDLRNAAGGTVGQPLAGVGVGIIQRGARLQIQDHHGSFGLLDDRQDLGGGGVGSHVAEDQIDTARRERPAPAASAFGASSTSPRADHRGPFADALLDLALVALQPLFESMELRPVGRQADSEYSHLGLFSVFHNHRHSCWLPAFSH